MTRALGSMSSDPAARGRESGRRALRRVGAADPAAVLATPPNRLGAAGPCSHPDRDAATVVAPRIDLIPRQGAIAC